MQIDIKAQVLIIETLYLDVDVDCFIRRKEDAI